MKICNNKNKKSKSNSHDVPSGRNLVREKNLTGKRSLWGIYFGLEALLVHLSHFLEGLFLVCVSWIELNCKKNEFSSRS